MFCVLCLCFRLKRCLLAQAVFAVSKAIAEQRRAASADITGRDPSVEADRLLRELQALFEDGRASPCCRCRRLSSLTVVGVRVVLASWSSSRLLEALHATQSAHCAVESRVLPRQSQTGELGVAFCWRASERGRKTIKVIARWIILVRRSRVTLSRRDGVCRARLAAFARASHWLCAADRARHRVATCRCAC